MKEKLFFSTLKMSPLTVSVPLRGIGYESCQILLARERNPAALFPTVSVPLRGIGYESSNGSVGGSDLEKFQSPCGELVMKVNFERKETMMFYAEGFQSPCGELVMKAGKKGIREGMTFRVSVPLRGIGYERWHSNGNWYPNNHRFQSPCGELVMKDGKYMGELQRLADTVSVPLRGIGYESGIGAIATNHRISKVSVPLRGIGYESP